MKTIFNSTLFFSMLLIACISQSCRKKTSLAISENKLIDVVSPQADTLKNIFSINEIIMEYINLKNALTQDNSKEAALASKSLLTAQSKMNLNSLTSELKLVFTDLAEDIKENAEHIGDNTSNIEHQREHFAILSRDINDLLDNFKTDKKLYQIFCSMFDDGKGAIWISETKEIKNPYYGSNMLTCGSVKKEF